MQPEGVKLSPLCPEQIGFLLLVQELQTANGIKKLVSVMLKLHMQTGGKVQTSCKLQNEDCRLGLKF